MLGFSNRILKSKKNKIYINQIRLTNLNLINLFILFLMKMSIKKPRRRNIRKNCKKNQKKLPSSHPKIYQHNVHWQETTQHRLLLLKQSKKVSNRTKNKKLVAKWFDIILYHIFISHKSIFLTYLYLVSENQDFGWGYITFW